MRVWLLLFVLSLAGCAARTSIVLLDQTKRYAATSTVEVLLKPPTRPYVEIAKLESKGLIGEAEPVVIEDARKRAGEIGAHALILMETSAVYEPPIVMYDPWPPYLPWYQDRWRSYRFWYYPPPLAYTVEPYTLPGGNVYTVRAIAIRYRD